MAGMDASHLLDTLNPPQREAVSAAPGHTLVLAGAGSGKTRVLTHRIAWLIEVEQVPAWAILSVTFTNKAAGEMRGRLDGLLNGSTQGLNVGTFHGIAHRLLRRHWREAQLPESFQILDADDQRRLVKRVMQSLAVDEARFPPRQAVWTINAWKDEGKRPDSIETRGHPSLTVFVEIYRAYEETCHRGGLVDFAELLLRSHELWLHDPALLAHYRERWSYLLVDEFQDTNTLQYAWLRLLAGPHGQVFAVGDDDQAIYGWRGARVENVQHFLHDFPNVRSVRLEQNYRSSGTILKAANALIARNRERLGKNLWTADGAGQRIKVYAAYNEQDEARFVIECIREHLATGGQASDIAILYRSNAQSRTFEEQLVQHRLAYRVYGGQRFFERAEIKAALAYLRLAASRHDDAAFERAVNTPPRGIGDRTLDIVRHQARENNYSMWKSACQASADPSLGGRARQALHGFVALIEQLAGDGFNLSLAEQIGQVLASSQLREYYQRDRRGNAESRLENLDELVNVASRFEPTAEDLDAGLSELAAFLAHAALEAGEAQGGEGNDCVQLMTLHSAKGLEFSRVFLVGLEEGLFPSQKSIDEEGRLEEERRLAYVGITRARSHLTICHAESRRIHGSEMLSRPSRFLAELPAELLDEVRPRVQRTRWSQAAMPARRSETGNESGLQIGQPVRHPSFGDGVIVSAEGAGKHTRVQVRFANASSKWLVLAYARLTPL